MDCRKLADYLRTNPEGPLPAELRQHVEACADCQLHLAQTELSNTVATAPALAIPAAILQDLKPVRPTPPLWLLTLLCYTPAAIAIAWGLSVLGFSGWQAQTDVMRLFTFGSVTMALLAAGYGLSRQLIPGSPVRVNTRSVYVVCALLFASTVALLFHHHYDFDTPEVAWSCCLKGLGVALVASVLAFAVSWRGAWLNRSSQILLIGMLGAASSLLVLTMYCPVLSLGHVLFGHVGASLLVIGLAWGLGRIFR